MVSLLSLHKFKQCGTEGRQGEPTHQCLIVLVTYHFTLLLLMTHLASKKGYIDCSSKKIQTQAQELFRVQIVDSACPKIVCLS